MDTKTAVCPSNTAPMIVPRSQELTEYPTGCSGPTVYDIVQSDLGDCYDVGRFTTASTEVEGFHSRLTLIYYSDVECQDETHRTSNNECYTYDVEQLRSLMFVPAG